MIKRNEIYQINILSAYDSHVSKAVVYVKKVVNLTSYTELSETRKDISPQIMKYLGAVGGRPKMVRNGRLEIHGPDS